MFQGRKFQGGSSSKIIQGSNLSQASNNSSKKFFNFNNLRIINKSIFFTFIFLIVLGILNLFAISSFYAFKQVLFLIISIPICVLVISLNPRYLIKLSYLGFIISILLLLLVSTIGEVSLGARRWIDLRIFKFQPSEISKIIVVIVISRYYHFLKEGNAEKLKYAFFPILLILTQVILVLKQPDLGTSTILFIIGISVIFIAGLKFRYFIFAAIFCLLILPVGWDRLHSYQQQRIKTFLNPDADSLGTGYNIIQAKIAIGSGGFFGKGLFAGTQGNLEFLPESHTDFAFTLFAEQFGFLGCIILLFFYSLILTYGFRISLTAESHFIRLTSAGISCLFFISVIINLAMTSGLIPVVGNPLPFISYGGTFLISNLILASLLLNLEINKNLIIHSSLDSYMEK